MKDLQLPSEIYDRITHYVEDPFVDDWRHDPWPSQYYDTEKRQRLGILRQVNRGFCKSASIRLFRAMHSKLSASSLHNSPNRWAPKRLFEVSQSQYNGDVQEVEVDLEGDSAHREAFIEDLVALLPACLSNFRNLTSLSLSLPDGQRTLCTELICNIFRYVPLSSLKELYLRLPLAYDYASLLQETSTISTPSRSLIGFVMKRLKCLGFSVCDSSGAGRQSYFNSQVSSSHSRFPNHQYSHQFFELIEFAEELEYLRISCTHVLNMDTLNTKHLYKLRSLQLSRVRVSHTMLLSFIELNRETICSIWLCMVELNSGTWTKVLMQLCLHQQLNTFYMDSCGYSKDGQSAKWALWMLPPIDDPQDIESRYYPDEHALGNLQRHIIANRHAKGLPAMDEYYYHYTKHKPFEAVLASMQSED